MPDTHIRVMAKFQGRSGLAADMYVNTFYFVGANTPQEDIVLATTAVATFYNVSPPAGFQAVGAYLSARLFREYTIKCYDMDTPKVRVPTNSPGELPSPGVTNGPPEEVAVTLSYHASMPPVSGRRRGRIFLGPLNESAYAKASTTAYSRVSDNFSGDLCKAATVLGNTPLIQWSIRSTRPAENYQAIVGGYVDDALDTQRRRGEVSTIRTPFVLAG